MEGDSEQPSSPAPGENETGSAPLGAGSESGTGSDPAASGGTGLPETDAGVLPTEAPDTPGAPSIDEPEVLVHKVGNVKERKPASAIQAMNFRHPSCFSPGGLRRMRLRHEEFARALSARLSLYLRMEFSLHLQNVQTMAFREFASGLPDPTHLTLFRVDPLPGISLVEVPPRLALSIVDRLLGGPGAALTTDHIPSEIELALLGQAVHVILSEWATFWSGTQELKAVELGYENNGRYLRTAPHDAVMLVLHIAGQLGDCTETIQIAFPHYTVEPLVLKLDQSAEKAAASAPTVRTQSVAWNVRYSEVPIRLTAEWEGVDLSARAVAGLKVGDFISLSPECVDSVKVRLAEVPRFKGRLGSAGDRLAVEVVAPWKP